MKKLVLCDFDGTLFKKDSFIEFIKFNRGDFKLLLSYVILLPYILIYYFKLYTAENLKKRLFNFHFKKLSKVELEESGNKFCNTILLNRNLQNLGLLNKLNDYKNTGAEICVVSASLDIWIKPFAQSYNYSVLCTELNYANGIYEGEFLTKNCNGIEKKIRVQQHYELKQYNDIIAYGDSSGDKEMFELANSFEKITF